MECADRNIGELLENLHGAFHRLRKSSIDEELFDVLSGFEALVGPLQKWRCWSRQIGWMLLRLLPLAIGGEKRTLVSMRQPFFIYNS